jgi:hypothetical protein
MGLTIYLSILTAALSPCYVRPRPLVGLKKSIAAPKICSSSLASFTIWRVIHTHTHRQT